MSTLETNVFRIENANELSAPYRLHRVRGLSPEQEDYYRNLNILALKLRREMRSPVCAVQRNGETFVVLRESDAEPRAQHMLIRRAVYLEKSDEIFTLDFAKLDNDTRPVALRFLQSAVDGALQSQHHFWRANAGSAHLLKQPSETRSGIGLHRGFIVRAMHLPDGGIGLCVDVRYKYVSVTPLPARMDRRSFNLYKHIHAIYRFGHQWFEVRLESWDELDAQEYVFPVNGHQMNLVEYLQEQCVKPLPPELVNMPKDSAVVHYFSSGGEDRAAPAVLCYPVYATSDSRVRRAHGRTILPPHRRWAEIVNFVGNNLRNLKMGGAAINLSAQPIEAPRVMFQVPDLRFGNNKIISTRGTVGAERVLLDRLGQRRRELLNDKSAGFFVSEPFGQQYFFIPETINQSWGSRFLNDLRRKVNDLYPQDAGYEPKIIPYDDRKGRTFVEQGQALMSAAEQRGVRGGYAVVMIHEPTDRKPRHHDQLAAFAIRSLRKKCDVNAAVIHTAVGSECYELVRQGGQMSYIVRRERHGRFDGYLRNVALNKVLLTNEKWPFVLATPTHADLTIGVDVKSNYVGFTVVSRDSAFIATHGMECRQKEQLGADEMRKLAIETIRSYYNHTGNLVRYIVIQRDGRLFETELAGLKAALEFLRAEGFVSPNADFTCIEIGKSSFTSLRLFDVKRNGQPKPFINNPEVGEYFISNVNEGYLCATGRAFPRDGTVYPLHVRKHSGPMTIEQLLEDVYRLTALAWSRPEDCTRYPITIKLNDRRLFEDAGEFNEHEIELYEEETKL
jgi:hypothetical protein